MKEKEIFSSLVLPKLNIVIIVRPFHLDVCCTTLFKKRRCSLLALWIIFVTMQMQALFFKQWYLNYLVCCETFCIFRAK